jgi:trk system potassium uptake protein TrkH
MRWVAGMPWDTVLDNAPLIAISAQTGAGFTSLDIASLDPASKLVLIVSMLVGGGVGSTAGGIKILRLIILLRLLQLLVQRACLPANAVVQPRLGGHRLEGREIEHGLLIILLFLLIILLSWLPFLALGYAPLDALFDVVSAVATVGLSSGVVGPELPGLLKGVLCLDMLLGRLEGVALLLVLYPRVWIGRRME